MAADPDPDAEFFGNEAQISILERGQALSHILRGDGRFSYHGRTVGLVSCETGDMDLIQRLARLQGATHYASVAAPQTDGVLSTATSVSLQATHYARWEVSGTDILHAGRIASAITLPGALTIETICPETAPGTYLSFARMSLACGVLPACRPAHQGVALRARTLIAVTKTGRVVASAYATSYISDASTQAGRECFWGMLATDPEWRGQGLSLILGGRLLKQMQDDYGFSEFYTGVEPGNAPSEAVCGKLGLRPRGNSIITFADPTQLPGGRMTK